MGGGMRGLEAPTLVDRHVHEDGTVLHEAELGALDDVRGTCPMHEDRADYEIHLRQLLLDREHRREHRRCATAEGDVELAQAVDVGVVDEDVCLHPDRDERRVHANGPAADDHHIRGRYPWDPAQQDPPAAERFLQHEGARLCRDLPRDLAHRREQREAPLGVLDGLVGDAGRTGLAESSRQIGRRGQVQVRKQGHARTKPLHLLGLRFLDPQDELGLAPDLVERDDPGALRLVVGIADRAALAGALLNQNLVAVLGELASSDGRQRDAVLVVLDLGGNAYLQTVSSTFTSTRQPRGTSSANSASGSTQLSGGRTPRSVIAPRASRRTAAAAGVAVDTTPPPIPHLSIGSVTARTRTARPFADASTTCTDTVRADGGRASAALR